MSLNQFQYILWIQYHMLLHSGPPMARGKFTPYREPWVAPRGPPGLKQNYFSKTMFFGEI